jgi:hypothetical protein
VNLLQRIHALLQLKVIIRELSLLVRSAELLLNKSRSPGRKRREGRTRQQSYSSVGSSTTSDYLTVTANRVSSRIRMEQAQHSMEGRLT